MTQAYAPDPFEGLTKKERNRLAYGIDRVVEKVVASILIRRSAQSLLREVYMAGLYHGSLSARGWSESDPNNSNNRPEDQA